MTDWTDSLTPAERAEFDDFIRQVREGTVRKMDSSAFVASIAPKGEPDIKYAVELGLGILMDKPMILIAMAGQEIPPRLLRAADKVIYADIDTAEGQGEVARQLAEFTETLGG